MTTPLLSAAFGSPFSFLGRAAQYKPLTFPVTWPGIAQGVPTKVQEFFGPVALLIVLVVVFLLAHGSFDRRDPRLARAPLDQTRTSVGFN